MLERNYQLFTVGILALTLLSFTLAEDDFGPESNTKNSDPYLNTDSLAVPLHNSIDGDLSADLMYHDEFSHKNEDKRSSRSYTRIAGFRRRLDPLMFGGRLGKRSYENDMVAPDEKRRPLDRFSFGSMLGKRAIDRYSFLGALGKRAIDRFSFADHLGKRLDEDGDYDIEPFTENKIRRFDNHMFMGRLGKRGMDRSSYFGKLGKRLPDPHAFFAQLGKRGRPDYNMFIGHLGKRGRPDSHMFFGNLGKRLPDPRMFIGHLGKRQRMDSNMFIGHLGKRSLTEKMNTPADDSGSS